MVEAIKPSLNVLKAGFRTGKTKSIKWRKEQLQNLIRGCEEMRQELIDAASNDLGRSKLASELVDVLQVTSYAKQELTHIDQYVKDVPVETDLLLGPAKCFAKYEPLGVCLVYGTWNYPIMLSMKPVIQAVTAGNCVMLKPSELAPESSAAMNKLFTKYMDPECFKVVEGGPDVSKAVGQEEFDVVFFTGSTEKGKLVAQAAAKNLTPCILELGGKCPVVVSDSAKANLDFAVHKTVTSKFGNSGQTCIAPDYALIHESIHDEYIEKARDFMQKHYADARNNNETGRIISENMTTRAEELIATAGGEIITGGKVVKEEKFVEPTIILNPDPNSKLMQEEIFAPILPVMSYKNLDEAIEFINERHKPLAVYYLGDPKSSEIGKLGVSTSSGALVVNEMIMQAGHHELAFGGVGHSGYGRCNGYEGFKQLSNRKAVMVKNPQSERQFSMMTPPLTEEKMKPIKFIFNSRLTTMTQEQVMRKLKFASASFALMAALWAYSP